MHRLVIAACLGVAAATAAPALASAGSTVAYPPPCPPRSPGAAIADGNAYVYSGCIVVVVPLPGIQPPPSAA